MATARLALIGGTVLSVDPRIGELARGDVLVEDGRIAAVGERLDVGDADIVDASDRIVLPGFIDTHRHTWQALWRNIAADWTLSHYLTGLHGGLSGFYRAEDTYAGNLIGTLEALDSGITTLLDWSHNLNTPGHADGAVQALKESGARAVFAHGAGAPQWQVPSDVPHAEDARRVRAEHFSSDDQLVTMAMALRGPQFATMAVTEQDWRLARELGLRITVHVGDGEWGRSRPVARMQDKGMLGPDITYVHCNTLADDELAMIRDTGGTASVAADVEMQMGHGWPATGRLLRAGVRPSLSIDVTVSNGGHMFGAMRSTISAQRALDNERAVEAGETVDHLSLTCREVLEFATIEGARACGLDARIGSLTPGKEADIVVLRTDDLALTPMNNPSGAVVYAAHPGHVDSVFVAGRAVKRDGRLLGIDVDRVRRLAVGSRNAILERANADPRLREARLGGDWIPSTLTTPT